MITSKAREIPAGDYYAECDNCGHTIDLPQDRHFYNGNCPQCGFEYMNVKKYDESMYASREASMKKYELLDEFQIPQTGKSGFSCFAGLDPETEEEEIINDAVDLPEANDEEEDDLLPEDPDEIFDEEEKIAIRVKLSTEGIDETPTSVLLDALEKINVRRDPAADPTVQMESDKNKILDELKRRGIYIIAASQFNAGDKVEYAGGLGQFVPSAPPLSVGDKGVVRPEVYSDPSKKLVYVDWEGGGSYAVGKDELNKIGSVIKVIEKIKSAAKSIVNKTAFNKDEALSQLSMLEGTGAVDIRDKSVVLFQSGLLGFKELENAATSDFDSLMDNYKKEYNESVNKEADLSVVGEGDMTEEDAYELGKDRGLDFGSMAEEGGTPYTVQEKEHESRSQPDFISLSKEIDGEDDDFGTLRDKLEDGIWDGIQEGMGREAGVKIESSWLIKTRYDEFKKIVDEHQAAEVEGVMVDAQSANRAISVYDNLNPENQNKFETVPIEGLLDWIWKIAIKKKAQIEEIEQMRDALLQAGYTAEQLHNECLRNGYQKVAKEIAEALNIEGEKIDEQAALVLAIKEIALSEAGKYPSDESGESLTDRINNNEFTQEPNGDGVQDFIMKEENPDENAPEKEPETGVNKIEKGNGDEVEDENKEDLKEDELVNEEDEIEKETEEELMEEELFDDDDEQKEG